MGSHEDRTELLSQLKIDKTVQENSGISVTQLLLATASAAVLSGLVVFYLSASSGKTDAIAQPSTSNTTQAPAINTDTLTSKNPLSTPTAPVAANEAIEILNASGYITPRRIATVSAEIMGRITSVDVEEGLQVTEGQVLAKLDDSVASVNLELAKAQMQAQQASIQSLQADLDEARRVLQRIKQLEGKNYSSEAQLTRAQADTDKLAAALISANAQYNVSRLQVDKQQELLEDHTIRAPFSGIITVKNAQPGEIVSPSSAGGGFTRTGICTLVDMDSLEIEVDVNEAFIGRVRSGQSVIANLDAYPQWDIPASVIAIIPTADRAKATVSVRIKIEEKDARILPDMGVKVAFLK